MPGSGRWRDRVGAKLDAAIVLYTGKPAYTHDDGTVVLPLDCLWSTAQP